MTLKAKIIRNIYRESMSTLVILATILIISGHYKVIQPNVSLSNDMAILESEDLPSKSIPSELGNLEKSQVSINQLVADVNSGKAGNGEDRKKYLGKYYSEVQSIINKQYSSIKNISKKENTIKAVSGSKSEYQDYAYNLVIAMGWSESDFQSLINLWERESGWNPNAHNKSSGAHGIPQSLPASKMSSQGEDYYTNGYTQIRWGLDYILNRYGTPNKAWKHFQDKNWY